MAVGLAVTLYTWRVIVWSTHDRCWYSLELSPSKMKYITKVSCKIDACLMKFSELIKTHHGPVFLLSHQTTVHLHHSMFYDCDRDFIRQIRVKYLSKHDDEPVNRRLGACVFLLQWTDNEYRSIISGVVCCITVCEEEKRSVYACLWGGEREYENVVQQPQQVKSQRWIFSRSQINLLFSRVSECARFREQ